MNKFLKSIYWQRASGKMDWSEVMFDITVITVCFITVYIFVLIGSLG